MAQKKIYRNKTNLTQVIYDESNNKITLVVGGAVEGNPEHYWNKYAHILEEVKPAIKKPTGTSTKSDDKK